MPAGPGKVVQPNLALPLYQMKRTLTDAEISNIFTTPVVVVPAVPGHFIIPTWGHLFRPPGTAWTAGTFTGFLIDAATGALLMNSFDATILTAAAPFGVVMRSGSGGLGGLQFSSAVFSNASVNSDVRIKGGVGNPSGGSGGLEVTLFYYLMSLRLGSMSV